MTSTRRLARQLQRDYARSSVAASWPTPDVLPWSAWIQATFRDLRDFGSLRESRVCLDDWQAAVLWEEVFNADPMSGTLLMPGGAVDGFRDAWRLVHEWRLPWAALQARAGEDCEIFLRLASRYQARLDAARALDRAQLPGLLAGSLDGLGGPEVLFAGFDKLNPEQAMLAAALGPRVQHVAPYAHAAAPTLAAFADSRHELAAAAAWARQRLDENPAARLGIVVPDLEAQAPLLEDLLDEALSPERLLPGRGDAPRPWNLSLGAPLVDAPVIAAALLAMDLARDSMELADVGRLLRAPFFGGAEAEGAQRAALDAWLRKRAGDRISPAGLLGWLEGRDGAPACPRLGAAVKACLDELRSGPRRRPPSSWSATLTRALRHLGWPGDVPPDSPTWQTLQAWAELLETLSRLDAVSGAVTLGDALARLRRIGAEQRFQPETPAVPVQVLGLLETAGLEFDGLWISGLHDGALPAPLRPCALLPAALQREQGMPRACPDTELAVARQLMTRLAGAAPEVRCSYPVAREDEPLRPSPMVAALPPAEDGAAFAITAVAMQSFAARRLETLVDAMGPPVQGEVSGGTGLLTAQSACPFRAFALHRLTARELETPAPGVDGLRRGSFVHLALKFLWEELRDRDGLARLAAAERAGRVRAALAQAAVQVLGGLPDALVAIEIDEAALRIEELLQAELLRPDFKVVASEQRIGVELAALRINAQVDRVDEVTAGCVVLDYKTGAARVADWEGERPAEPQMPLYALAYAPTLAGLAYASLKPGDVQLRGRARSREVFGAAMAKLKPPSEQEWQAQIDAWRDVLAALARGFGAGDARVAPRQALGAGSTCARCHLATLCRRDELLRAGVLGHD